MIDISGQGGQIQSDGQYVTITRKGFLARASHGKGEKRLHVSQIAAIQWKPAGPIVNGFIQLTVPGGIEQRSKFGSQTLDATKDENSVVFAACLWGAPGAVGGGYGWQSCASSTRRSTRRCCVS
jgi:hypothetical protein